MGAPPDIVNNRGDKMSASAAAGIGEEDYDYKIGDKTVTVGSGMKDRSQQSPMRHAEMLMNWLTAGSRPKPLDPSLIFANSQAYAPLKERAGVGAGVNGLFGFGNMIGDMQPIKPLVGLSQSPLQKGVPSSGPAMPELPMVGK